MIFLGIYVVSFFLLVTLYSKYKFITFPGDILVGKIGLYLPFTSAAAFALFVVAMIEMYKFFKRF